MFRFETIFLTLRIKKKKLINIYIYIQKLNYYNNTRRKKIKHNFYFLFFQTYDENPLSIKHINKTYFNYYYYYFNYINI